MLKNNYLSSITILIHTGENLKIGYEHLLYWLPEFFKSDIKFGILVRNKNLYKTIKNEYRTIGVFFAQDSLEVEGVLNKFANLKAIFYMSNSSNNIHLLRFNEYKHIFIGNENYNRDMQTTKVLKAYDELWLQSQSIIDKIKYSIEDIDNMKIIKIGKPQLKDIINNKQKNSILCVFSIVDNVVINSIQLLIKYSIKKNMKIKFIFSMLDKKNNKFSNNITLQLKEILLKNNIECFIYTVFSDELLKESSFILCDLNSYNEKFIINNTPICIYRSYNFSIDMFLRNKDFPLEKIFLFSLFEELQDYLINGTHEEIPDEYINYYLGKKYIIDKKFQKEILRVGL
ncbi:hypothetical protein [Campylobacter peloridis]|uniref:hypothetical protein n=1 Tax=Campylobacter peloridis TaxID=488546 RepID=UPI001C733D87|nr:hypothetical protein [Campylobacter peloridis]MBX1885398.1 hypothetical protein [Campylobacter peloridis]